MVGLPFLSRNRIGCYAGDPAGLNESWKTSRVVCPSRHSISHEALQPNLRQDRFDFTDLTPPCPHTSTAFSSQGLIRSCNAEPPQTSAQTDTTMIVMSSGEPTSSPRNVSVSSRTVIVPTTALRAGSG